MQAQQQDTGVTANRATVYAVPRKMPCQNARPPRVCDQRFRTKIIPSLSLSGALSVPIQFAKQNKPMSICGTVDVQLQQ